MTGYRVESLPIEEIPAGAIDGNNDTFTLTQAPMLPSTLQLTLNGLRLRRSASGDFVLSGNTITFNAGAIPQTGDDLLATYRV